ncbi:MAG TPA: ubiquinol-cytochrome c reductase iron-sulfur subunit [Anaerolineales bacterium]|nr:ubiquinol-cytochrome c reductase iron-sulfur subunit [Anaerolineales bacterium]
MLTESEKTPSPTLAEKPSVFTSRRNFLQFGIAAVGAAWAGTLLQTRLFPIQTGPAEARPVEFPLSELPVGQTKLITYAGQPAIVLRTTESIKAFSLICTHLGCTVEWQAANLEFYCPCHDGRFDQFGEVTAGPPPVPLEAYPVQIVDDKVVVGETA